MHRIDQSLNKDMRQVSDEHIILSGTGSRSHLESIRSIRSYGHFSVN